MSGQHFIALDTHCEFCEMVAVTNSGKIVNRERTTTIPALAAALESVRRPRTLTFEEGPLADWLARNCAACRAADRMRAAAECPDRQRQ